MNRVVIKATSRSDKKAPNYPWEPQTFPAVDLPVQKLRDILVNDFKLMFSHAEIVGNAFLHPQFEGLLEMLKTLKLAELSLYVPVGLQIKERADALTQRGVSAIKMHMAGIDARTNDMFLGKGSFRVLQENIDAAQKAGLRVVVEFLVNRKNWQTLPDVIEYAQAKSIGAIFTEMMPLGAFKKRDAAIIGGKDLLMFWDALLKWKERNNLPDIGGYSAFVDNHYGCEYARTVFINEHGNTAACYLDSLFMQSGKNKTANKKCADCFSWKEWQKIKMSGKERKIASKAADKKNEAIFREVFRAYDEIKNDRNQPAEISGKIKIAEEKLEGESLMAVAEAFQIARHLGGMKIDWQNTYQAQKKKALFRIGYKYEYKKVKKIIQDIRFSGMRDVTLMGESGNDILRYKALRHMLGDLQKGGFSVTAWLGGFRSKKDEKLFSRFGVSRYFFEVYGANAETHDRLTRKKGSFDEIMASIEGLLEKKEAGEIQMGLGYVLSEENAEELSQMVGFAGMLAVGLTIIPMQEKHLKLGSKLIPSSHALKMAEELCRVNDDRPENARVSFWNAGEFEVYSL